MKILLTDVAIKRLNPPEKGQLKVWDTKLAGFGLLVGKRTKTFLVVTGRDRRNVTIGRYPQKSLKEARNEARGMLAHVSHKNAPTGFVEAHRAFLDDCSTRIRQSTIDRYYYSLKTIEAKTLDSVPTNITDPNQLKALKVFYNWCIDHKLIDHNPFIRRKVVFKKRERVLSDDEVRKIWHYDHTPYSDILKALLLTGQRRNQIWKFDPNWIEDNFITFPSWVMKSGRPHTLPLTGYEQYLKPTTFNGWSKSKVRIDEHTGVSDWVVHDLRRYFSTTMAKIGTPLHITEQILDHRSTLSGVALVYNKYTFLNEMKEALESYQKYINTVIAQSIT